MYRHCIYCSVDLGRNDAVERFPVGRQIAVDAEKGRLWAICTRCARWNLAPIEERWEAVEEAEKCFVDARLKVQRENVGLAKLGDGTRLIRIGRAEGRELAAWRYGDELRRRERAGVLRARAGVVTNLGLLAASVFSGPAVGFAYMGWYVSQPVLRVLNDRRVVHRLADPGGHAAPRVIRRTDLAGSWVKHDGEGLVLALPAVSPDRRHLLRLRGHDALRVVERAMVLVNRAAVHPRQLDAAMGALSAAPGPDEFLRSVLGPGRVLTRGNTYGIFGSALGLADEPALRGPEALAVEMALHEEAERRVLEGELTMLESAWREAEEIAAIADKLALAPDAKG
jgi:hypothetical protein